MLDPETQKQYNSIFCWAAIVYELGGNWRRELGKESKNNNSLIRQFCKKGMQASNNQMELAIKYFLIED